MIFDEKTASAFPVLRFPIFQPIGARFRPSEAPLSASSLSLDISPLTVSWAPGGVSARPWGCSCNSGKQGKGATLCKTAARGYTAAAKFAGDTPFEFRCFFRDAAQRSPVRDPVEIGASPSRGCWGLDGCTVGAFKVQRRPIMHPVKHTKNHAAQPFQPYLLLFDLFSRFLFLLHLGPVQGVTKWAIFFSASVLSSGSEKARSDADPLAVPFSDGKCVAWSFPYRPGRL